VDVIVCTGRPPRMVRAIAADLELTRVIVYQGSATFHADGDRVEVHRQMSREFALNTIHGLRASFPDVMCGIETDHGWYVDASLARFRQRDLDPDETGPDGTGDVCDFIREGVVKLVVRHPSRGARELAASLDGAPVYRTWTGPNLLEILADGVNKQIALQQYAGAQGVSRDRVAAFGDQHNDREMLAWAGLGVAMANASEEAREAADIVTDSNDDDGVAVLLESWAEAIHD
jgi:Cof subfamily protein (haloacid dehalogenase superfamily)